ncbi:MAG: hypothetical protein M1294_08325 [Firmicutes bacterium]|nr:hypothetical protein [Bacillota bacterium]
MGKNTPSQRAKVVEFPIRRRMRQGRWLFVSGVVGGSVMGIAGGFLVKAVPNWPIRIILALSWVGLGAMLEYVLWLIWLGILIESSQPLHHGRHRRIPAAYRKRKGHQGR